MFDWLQQFNGQGPVGARVRTVAIDGVICDAMTSGEVMLMRPDGSIIAHEHWGLVSIRDGTVMDADELVRATGRCDVCAFEIAQAPNQYASPKDAFLASRHLRSTLVRSDASGSLLCPWHRIEIPIDDIRTLVVAPDEARLPVTRERVAQARRRIAALLKGSNHGSAG